MAHAFSDRNLNGDVFGFLDDGETVGVVGRTDADRTFLQLGYDRAITDKILFVADYYSGRSPISGIQPTLYYSVNDKASFGIGYFFNNAARGADNADQLYLCFDYNFGGPAAAAGEPALGDPGAPAG